MFIGVGMLGFQEVVERIKDIISKEIGERKIYDKDVAAVLGLTPEHFSMLKRRKRLPLPELLDFCAKRRISINWLLYDQDPASLHKETEKFAYVKYFKEVNASAGGGAFNYELVSQKLFLDEEIVEILGGKKRLQYIQAINVLGDSMEPTLKDGSIAFVDTSQQDIKKGGLFLISTNAGLFIKRIRLRTDKMVELVSDNANYAIEEVEPESVTVVGRVIGSIEKI
ncbi:hypothetical protein NitYY0826_C0325 [Nitratiruptor sp. YY08-26]|uniref:S24 family peptidase n=1 Tax=unclassified Nitratiruptor TaxID=2624044 RepID=UPI001937B8ED|nr:MULTISPECIES: S24 family peptidase [unclassified Nitratiruptor]BCD61473.1 hypothetical protein NitYY0813_C0324 [Nitratiruptor sp. YY08-13]BCD65407.1 hypothetical protein NitYY0826_C0325 [Nitratiruptor sp. YY08-26]